MSNSRPKDHSTTYVKVRTGAFAQVVTIAHYSTASTKHWAANGAGRAAIAYRIPKM
jgi:hypothetical protein